MYVTFIKIIFTLFVWASLPRCFSKDRNAFTFRIKRPPLTELGPEDERNTIHRKS